MICGDLINSGRPLQKAWKSLVLASVFVNHNFCAVHVSEVIFGVFSRSLNPIRVDCYILPSLLITTLTTEASLMLHYVIFVALFRQTLIRSPTVCNNCSAGYNVAFDNCHQCLSIPFVHRKLFQAIRFAFQNSKYPYFEAFGTASGLNGNMPLRRKLDILHCGTLKPGWHKYFKKVVSSNLPASSFSSKLQSFCVPV